jgi:hypothetical protein
MHPDSTFHKSCQNQSGSQIVDFVVARWVSLEVAGGGEQHAAAVLSIRCDVKTALALRSASVFIKIYVATGATQSLLRRAQNVSAFWTEADTIGLGVLRTAVSFSVSKSAVEIFFAWECGIQICVVSADLLH